MAEITYIQGDLFKHVKQHPLNKSIIVAHVCNDEGGWGSGFVVPLSKHWPITEGSYRKWHKTKFTIGAFQEKTPFKLGKTQFVSVKFNDETRRQVVVANMVAQRSTIDRDPGSRPLRYWALSNCMRETLSVAHEEADPVTEFHIPKFGSGLAGGNWQFIETLIEEIWASSYPVFVYELTEEEAFDRDVQSYIQTPDILEEMQERLRISEIID